MHVRLKKSTFKKLTKILKQSVTEKGIQYQLHDAVYIDTSVSEDFDIENTKITAINRYSSSKIYSLMERGSDLFLCMCNNEIDISKIPDVVMSELTTEQKGFWVLFITEVMNKINLANNDTAYEIYDKFLSFDDEEDKGNAKEIKFNDIESLLPSIKIYKVHDSRISTEKDLSKIQGYIEASAGNSQFNEDIISLFTEMFQSSYKIPFETLYLSMTSNHYKQSFIEIYRCIERLYPIPALAEFYQTVQTPVTCNIELAEIIENTIGWRPKESESLEKILSELDQDCTLSLNAAKSETPFSSFSNANFIYKLRNANVHFRKSLGTTNLSEKKWQEIILAMLKVTKNIYKIYDGKFN